MEQKDKTQPNKPIKKKIRCTFCNKRLKTFISRFECKCGNIYCTKCRYVFVHKCSINTFKNNQEKLKQDNQIIVNDKINKI